MVTINLTLLVETGLFLIFLWMMHRYVFRPILKTMDDRDTQLEVNQIEAQRLEAEAHSLEREFKEKLAALHKEASHRILHVQRKVQEEHLQNIAALKQRETEELRVVRNEAAAQVAEERTHYPELSKELQHLMAVRLHLERDSS